MKKKENYEGEVIRLKFPNKGIVKVAGEEEIVQVKNTLPGQKISFQLKILLLLIRHRLVRAASAHVKMRTGRYLRLHL